MDHDFNILESLYEIMRKWFMKRKYDKKVERRTRVGNSRKFKKTRGWTRFFYTERKK